MEVYSNRSAQVSPDDFETQLMELVESVESMEVEQPAEEIIHEDGKRRQAEKDVCELGVWVWVWLCLTISSPVFEFETILVGIYGLCAM